MIGKRRSWRWLLGLAVLAVAECATVAAIDVAITTPAEAQFFDDRYSYQRRQRPQRSGGFFQNLFGGFDDRMPERGYGRPPQSQPQQQPHVDYSRAPPPRKADPKAEPVTPTTSIVVMGDSMADWLAYGLEDAFADAPEIAVVRKNKPRSGLVRYEAKSDLDWWHVARDILAQEKANYVVMMLGLSDRQNIRESDVEDEVEAAEQSKPQQNAPAEDKTGKSDQKAAATPEPKAEPKPEPKAKKSNAVIEFRTDRWAAVYSRRIDETTAALKSKGVPVFWVGLPSIRGTRSTADAVYLNELFRARAERAGAVYVDVWDGFVDDSGKYSSYGPDYEGQVRRLRSGDGVFFTKYGARKLAHYVEREIRRYMNNRATPVALPSGPLAPVPGEGKSAVRPLAGPVVPLTVAPGNADVLAGGTGAQPMNGDSIATQVLVKGEAMNAPAGRADDFAWPPGSNINKTAQPQPSAPAAANAVPPKTATANAAPADAAAPPPAVAAPNTVPANAAAPAAKPKSNKKPAMEAKKPATARSAADRTAAARARQRTVRPDNGYRPPQNIPQPHRSQSIFGTGNPFGWMR